MWAVLLRNPLLWIMLCALGLRLTAVVVLETRLAGMPDRKFLIAGDASGYWELGRRIAAGKDYQLYTPPRRVLRMPGLPLLLAATIRIAGESLTAARVLLAVVGATACGLVYLLGRELVDRRVGLIAAGLAAASPAFIGFSPLILSETLFAALMLLSLLAAARFLIESGVTVSSTLPAVGDASRPGRLTLLSVAMTVGVTVAAACYVRPSWLLIGLFFPAIHFLRADDRRWAFLCGVVTAAAMFATLLPWAVRNRRVTGHWVWTTLWVGPSLYDGLNPGATGDSNMQFYDDDDLLSRPGLSEYDVDRHYRKKAWDFVRNNPWRAIELGVLKSVRYWKPWPNAEQFQTSRYAIPIAAFSILLFTTAIAGVWTHRSQFWLMTLTVGPIVYFALIHAVFVGSLRYRLPAEYPLCVLSAAGIQTIFSWRSRDKGQMTNDK